jgi:hypothetical protein
MRGELFANFVNRIDQRIVELLVSKMHAHCFHNALPKLIPASFMNRVVANDREFMHTRRDKNQHSVAPARLVHTEPVKLLLRRD